MIMKFFPTSGRFSVELTPTARNSSRGPIPEWRRICGVPRAPADRTISLLAIKVCRTPNGASEGE